MISEKMRQAACKAITDRGKGNNVTIPDIIAMLEAAIQAPLQEPVDTDDELRAAAREAGWALMELVDGIDWTKREHVSKIITRVGLAISTDGHELPELRPVETAPKNNTLLRLLVDYGGEGDHPLEDTEKAWTIGFNNFEDSEIDEWQFAGWSWTQDCFCEGRGRVVGWAPFHSNNDNLTGAARVEAIARAAQTYVDAVSGQPEKDCWDTEDGKEAPDANRFSSDWAWKAYDERKQQAFDSLCATLSSPIGAKPQDDKSDGSRTRRTKVGN